ncbi:MAG: hypothetical protein P1Q69_20180, partial [Candidatus Thorarchaeota archaeon]|nr:hypothetical protein [Candidatus Thorarchaeota archaeon]
MHLIERKLAVTRSNTEKLLLLSLFLSMSMLGPFFQPVFGNTVIVMHHDASVDISLKTLQEQTGPLHVIEYGSAEYLLVIHRLVDSVIWLSHGSDDGILTETGYMEWVSFAKILDMTRATDIVLACNSDNLDAFVKNPVITFSGSIDARFGAAIVAWLLTASITSLSFVFEIFIKLMTHDLSLLPLYWGPIEKTWFFLDAAIFILQTVSITFMVFWATLNPMSTLQLLAGMVYLGTALIQACEVLAALLTGNLTPWAFI